MQVAFPLCTPEESHNRTTIVEDHRKLTINAIVTIVHSFISNLKHRSFCEFYVVLSPTDSLSDISPTLVPTAESALDIVKY